jgi:hypothetical protein
MKLLSVLVLPVSATLAFNPQFLGRRFVNGTNSVSALSSDPANSLATVIVEVPTEVVTGTPAGVTDVTVVEENETGTVTRTVQNTISSYITVTNTLTRTLTAPSSAVQDVVNSAVEAKGVAVIDNTIVSKETKTLTVTNYYTATAGNSSQAVVDTITVERLLTKVLDNTTTVPTGSIAVSTALFRNSTSESPIVSTITLTKTRRSTITRPVTSTITNFITVTNSAGEAVETKTSVNEFVYNTVETIDTADSTVTSTITLTTSTFKRTVTNIIYFTYTYTTTNSNGNIETRTATNAENVVQTQTHLLTVAANPTAEASATRSAPTVLSTGSAWNSTEPIFKRAYRHKHRAN